MKHRGSYSRRKGSVPRSNALPLWIPLIAFNVIVVTNIIKNVPQILHLPNYTNTRRRNERKTKNHKIPFKREPNQDPIVKIKSSSNLNWNCNKWLFALILLVNCKQAEAKIFNSALPPPSSRSSYFQSLQQYG